jgi:hypothetical protein
LNDIINLHAVEGKIWIQTSTMDPQKGILIDVYEPSGRYLDCFYLKCHDGVITPTGVFRQLVFSGGFVYFADKTADDLVVIKKCRLIGL